MSNTSQLNIAYLDFDNIKTALRDYLRSQDQFKDFDFEGSGLAVLLDLLSYNTHYNGFYTNMASNEGFLDSASLRSSVVSKAKQLNYTPRSITSARATVSITITPTDGASNAIIEKNTRFTSNVDGDTFIFIADKAYGTTIQNGKFIFPEVTLIEGTPYTYRFTVDSAIPNQRFILPNPNVDTSSLVVRVQKSSSDTTLTSFVLADNVLAVTSESKVYFLQEAENQQFEIVFGDGIIGHALEDGNIVMIDYVISNGPDANGASIFVPSTLTAGYSVSQTSITTLVSAAGGLEAETTEQIRFNAPKNFEVQDRAVTAGDYKFSVGKDYTNADSVAVWGGEKMTPPQPGKVFISIKPVNGFVVTEAAKSLVVDNLLRKKNIVSVMPQIIDPDYTFITVNTKVKYQPAVTTKTDGQIRQGAYDAIVKFSSVELDKFDRELRYSKLLSAIDLSDPSISNNLTTLMMKKVFTPSLGSIVNYSFDFNNAVVPGSLQSSSFITTIDPKLLRAYVSGKTYTIQDDGVGALVMYEHGIGIEDTVVRTCGTIDYTTGRVFLTEFVPTSADVNGQISITVAPKEDDIVPQRNNILFIKPEDIVVNVSITTSRT